MRRIMLPRSRKKNRSILTRNIVNVIAIAVIASTAITWIGVMEINKD